MKSEIYRPLGIYIVMNEVNGKALRLPIIHLSVGKITFALEESKTFSDFVVKGVEVHGELLNINSKLEMIEGSRAAISWSTYSFDFSLFEAWVRGLNVDQKEALIGDLIDWHEDLESVAHLELNQFKRSA